VASRCAKNALASESAVWEDGCLVVVELLVGGQLLLFGAADAVVVMVVTLLVVASSLSSRKVRGAYRIPVCLLLCFDASAALILLPSQIDLMIGWGVRMKSNSSSVSIGRCCSSLGSDDSVFFSRG